MTTITMTFELSVEDFEAIVFSAGYGIGYWASAAVVGENDDTYTVTNAFDGKETLITPAKMAKAIGEMFAANDWIPPQVSYTNVSQGLDNFVRHNWTQTIDSEVADCIIQWCCFGKIIYG